MELPDEPNTMYIHELAKKGAEGIGHHGPVTAMGIPAPDLPPMGQNSNPHRTTSH